MQEPLSSVMNSSSVSNRDGENLGDFREEDFPANVYIESPEFDHDRERYFVMLHKNSKNAVDTLRTLHATKHLSRLAFSHSLAMYLEGIVKNQVKNPPLQIDVFYRTGMLTLLADILKEKAIYCLDSYVTMFTIHMSFLGSPLCRNTIMKSTMPSEL